jgi:hypothetical protein
MEDIIKLLPNLLRLAQNNDEVCERASFVAWRTAVGAAIARVSLPQRLTRKMLIVAVTDETWKRQLEQMSSQILFKINTMLGSAMVTGVEFIIDPNAIRAAQPKTAKPLEAPKIDAQLLLAATQISDPDLRARFLKTAGKYLQAQESKPES